MTDKTTHAGEIMVGGEVLMQSLLAQGVDTIFGYPGGAIMPVYDRLYDHLDEINHVLVRHEQGAAHAAQGYARVSGKVGVCMVTSGPGATNTVTGIADAMIDSTPVVVIAGQVGTAMLGSDAFQEVDLVGITQPIAKWSYQVRRAEDIPMAIARAFYIASTGRPGPVVLDLTKNAQVDTITYKPAKIDFIRSYDPDPAPKTGAIDEAAAMINSAEKPLVLVGQGVVLGDATEELVEFLEKANLPAASTLLGLSAMPSDYPLNMGMLGMHGNLGPNVKTNECDVLIAVGMRFDDRVTANLKTYAPQAKVVHFDIDAAELGKNVPVDVPVLGNCKWTLQRVTELLEEKDHSTWIESFQPYAEKEHDAVCQVELTSTPEGHLRMGQVARRISEATENKGVLVTDVGQNQMLSARYFQYTQPRSVVTSGGLGTMGFGLPAAIGATFGSPDRTVCLMTGDGGIQMSVQEFGTIMEQQAPVKIVILNNDFLGNVRQWQAMFFKNRLSFTPMHNPRYEHLAAAYNIPYCRATTESELNDAIHQMLTTDGPFLLEAVVEKEGNVMPMVPPGGTISEMVLSAEG